MHDSPYPFPGNQQPAPPSQVEELTRIFNTALLSTRVGSHRDFSTELHSLLESPAFRAILTSVRQLARNQGTTEKEAAELVIETFRKVDRIWADYVFQEGVDKLSTRA